MHLKSFKTKLLHLIYLKQKDVTKEKNRLDTNSSHHSWLSLLNFPNLTLN